MAAIEIRRRGAKRVVAIDSDDRYPSLVRFAVETCAADIEFHRLSLFPAAALRERLDLCTSWVCIICATHSSRST
jgi:tRNA (mo5U34)-methyltransferase